MILIKMQYVRQQGSLLVICLYLLLIPCLSFAQTTNDAMLKGAGMPSFQPLCQGMPERFSQTLGRTLSYQSSGSDGGIRLLKNRQVDFVVSDAPLSRSEERSFPMPIRQIPIAGEATVIPYHLPSLHGQLALTGAVVADIFRGGIKRWNDQRIQALNPSLKLPDVAITPVHQSEKTGDTLLFTNYLCHVSPVWKKEVGSGKSVTWPVGPGGRDGGWMSVVQQTVGAIGYVELEDALRNNLTVCKILNRTGYAVNPSLPSVKAALSAAVPLLRQDIFAPIVDPPGRTSYPIIGFVYMIVTDNAADKAQRTEIAQLLRWTLEYAQHADFGYMPLPESAVQFDRQTIQELSSENKG